MNTMKKMTALAMAGVLLAGVSGCSTISDEVSLQETTFSNQDVTEETTAEAVVESNPNANTIGLLETIWAAYDESERFPAAGGDMTEENMRMDAPGKYGLGDAEALDSTFGLPADVAPLVDDISSLMHMMNANTFTCGVFHVAEISDSVAVVDGLKNNILSRQWMCGMPDQLIIIQEANYIISFFGEQEITDTFREKVLYCYPESRLICQEPITQ